VPAMKRPLSDVEPDGSDEDRLCEAASPSPGFGSWGASSPDRAPSEGREGEAEPGTQQDAWDGWVDDEPLLESQLLELPSQIVETAPVMLAQPELALSAVLPARGGPRRGRPMGSRALRELLGRAAGPPTAAGPSATSRSRGRARGRPRGTSARGRTSAEGPTVIGAGRQLHLAMIVPPSARLVPALAHDLQTAIVEGELSRESGDIDMEMDSACQELYLPTNTAGCLKSITAQVERLCVGRGRLQRAVDRLASASIAFEQARLVEFRNLVHNFCC
jgi:hypothetical protein